VTKAALHGLLADALAGRLGPTTFVDLDALYAEILGQSTAS
jgi:hypothetical protein